MKQSSACNSTWLLRGVLSALLGTALITGTANAAPTEPTYRIVELPLLPDTEFSEAKDISDAGQIVGEGSEWGSGGYRYGISWGVVPHAPQRLPGLSPDSLQTIVTAVNNSGFVVGNALMTDGDNAYYVAVMWDPSGVIVELGDLPQEPYMSKAFDINASGAAVGYDTISFWYGYQHRPVFWTAPGRTRALQIGGRDIQTWGSALALNDFGDIVGYRYFSWEGCHAARWPAGQRRIQDLGDLPGGDDFSFAYAINNAGQVVGSGHSDRGLRAVLWNSVGSMKDLGDVHDGSDYEALDINEAGQVVGSFVKFGYLRQAFLWTAEDGMMDLYDLIDPADPLRELFGTQGVYVHAINASGLIVGQMSTGHPDGSGPHAIVLVPVE